MCTKARYEDHELLPPVSFRFARGIIKARNRVLVCQNSEVLRCPRACKVASEI